MKAPFLQCIKYFHTISCSDLLTFLPPDSHSDFDAHLVQSIQGLKDLRKDLSAGKLLTSYYLYAFLGLLWQSCFHLNYGNFWIWYAFLFNSGTSPTKKLGAPSQYKLGNNGQTLYLKLSQLMILWYLSHRRPAKAHSSLRICAVSPEPLLFAHMKYGSRRRKNQTSSPIGWLHLRVWTKSSIITWDGSIVSLVFFRHIYLPLSSWWSCRQKYSDNPQQSSWRLEI